MFFNLPLSDIDNGIADGQQARDKKFSHKQVLNMAKKKILIVDDEEDSLFVLNRRLSTRGFLVIEAHASEDAIRLAISEHPDLIILDVLMPGMYGDEVSAILKEILETKDIPVIFLSCLYSRIEDAAKDPIIGDYPFVSKYDTEDLLVEIEKLLQEVSVEGHGDNIG